MLFAHVGGLDDFFGARCEFAVHRELERQLHGNAGLALTLLLSGAFGLALAFAPTSGKARKQLRRHVVLKRPVLNDVQLRGFAGNDLDGRTVLPPFARSEVIESQLAR